MSNKLINLVYSRQFGSSARKAVALKLADVARDDGSSIYPSVGTIAAETELSGRWVIKTLRQLQHDGVLKVVAVGGGRNRPNRYRLDLDAVAALPASKSVKNPELSSPFKGSTDTEKGELSAPFTAGNPELSSKNPELSSPEPLRTLITLSERAPTSETPTPTTPLPPGGGAVAPSVNGMIWKEGVTLLSPYVPEARSRSLIGKWCKRANQGDNLPQLLTIIRAAQRAGTADPVPYVEAALADAFPPPPDPAKLTDTEWGYRIRVAIERKEWLSEWGAKPGDAKCLVPAHLVTEGLLFAMRFTKQRAA